jgi:hypothetical protein
MRILTLEIVQPILDTVVHVGQVQVLQEGGAAAELVA